MVNFKKLFLLGIVLTSSLALADEGLFDAAPKDPQLLERWNASVAFYASETKYSRLGYAVMDSSGSGTVVAIEPADENGMHDVYIVTAWHVVNPKVVPPYSSQIILDNSTIKKKGLFRASDVVGRGITLVAKDAHLDTAIVKVKVSDRNAARIDIAPYGCNFNQAGVVHAIGFPATSNFTEDAVKYVPHHEHWVKRISSGKFFEFSRLDDDFMAFSVDGYEGSSGGGLYNDRGELMSLISSGGDRDHRNQGYTKPSFSERDGYRGVALGPECNNFVDFIHKHLPASALAYSEYHPNLPEFEPEYEGTTTADSQKAGALR